MITNISITNNLGFSYTFDQDSSRIVNGLDLSGLQADINYLETVQPGSRYQNTRLRNRNFEIVARLYKYGHDYALEDIRRQELYKVINPELNPMRFDFQTSDGSKYYLIANAASTPTMSPERKENNAAFQNVLMQFLCTDPYIYQEEELEFTNDYSILDNSEFEFDLEISQNGISFEDIGSPLSTITFDYPGDSPDGFTVRFETIGSVSNPTLINELTGERMGFTLNMVADATLTAKTYPGQRSVRYFRNGIDSNAFSTFDFQNSRFLKLNPGQNQFSYSVTAGDINNLRVFISYRVRKVGL